MKTAASSKTSPRLLRSLLTIFGAVCLLSTATACRDSAGNTGTPNQSVVVKAPAAGQVHRLLVSEGVKVDAGTPIIEMAPETTAAPTGTSADNPETQAIHDVEAANREVEAARAETVRNEANVQRLIPLVAAGQASQSELDGARAEYDRSQQRLQRAQDTVQRARTGLDVARQPGVKAAPTSPVARPDIISVRAPAAGTLTVIGARVGDRVVSGQPLATIRPD